jgi:Domain of unknown function (DUF5134)
VAVTGSTGWAMGAALLCLCTGLGCLALAAAGVGDRISQLTHAGMGVAMAGMLSPWGDPVPPWTGVVAFALIGAWFAAVVLRRGRTRRTARHLMISSAAMVLMYLLHEQPGVGSAGPGAGHAGHPALGGSAADLIVMPVSLVLAGYFVWHTWTCVEHSRAGDEPPSARRSATPQAVVGRVRVEPVAHGVMSALMAAMFLGAV